MFLRSTLIAFLAMYVAFAGCSPSSESKTATHRERGLAYFEKGQYQEALLEFKNMVQVDPKNADGHYRLALTLLKIGGLPNLQAAFAELTKTTELDPNNRDAQLKLGAMYLLSRMPEKALERADLILTSTPQDVDGLVLRGQSLIGEKEYEKGVADLKQASQLDPKNIRIYLDLARTYVLMKDLPAAEASLQAALTVDPQSLDARLALGDFRALTGKPQEAEAEYKRALEANPDKDVPYLKLAGFYQLTRRWADAEGMYQQLATRKPNEDGPQIILADYYAFLGQGDKARSAYQRALEVNAKSIPARNKLIDHDLNSGKAAEAEARIREILAKNPKDLDGRYFDARLKLARGNTDEAIDLLQRVLKDEPQSAGAHQYLGLAFLAKNDPAQARRELTDAVKLSPAMPEARTGLAALHLAEGNTDLAIEHASAAIQLNPLRVQPVIILGDAYLRKGDLSKAKTIYEAFIKAAPKEPLGYYKLALIARAEKKDDEALARLEEALAANPNFVDPLAQIVSIYAGRGKPQMARDRIIRQLEISPKNPQIYTLQGRLLVGMRDFALAEASYKKAIELDATAMPAYLSLAELYRGTGRVDQAIKEYEGLIAKNPKWVPGYLLLGMINESQKDYDKAKARYAEALKINPKFSPAANNLAYLMSEQGGDLDQALVYAQTAHEVAPNDPSIADTLGWIYYKKKAYLKAIDLLKEAAEKMPDNPVVQYHFGMVQFMKGDTIGAKKNLQAALKLSDTFPGSEEAKKTLQAL